VAVLFMDKEPVDNPPGCSNCSHYYITHDANFRYGCRGLGFKSQRQPSLDVFEASVQQCHYFQKKYAPDPSADDLVWNHAITRAQTEWHSHWVDSSGTDPASMASMLYYM
jgi:hypothetical protein